MTNINNPPNHVAIIMDGNRRWAKQKDLDAVKGHEAGIKTLVSVAKAASDLKIKFLTLFSFSKENWNRPLTEVSQLMILMKTFSGEYLKDINKYNIKIKVIGDMEDLGSQQKSIINKVQEETKNNSGLLLLAAFNYSGRNDLKRAIDKILCDIESQKIKSNQLTELLVSDYLDTALIPDPDLIIRTGGEKRLSNFLLWQCAYSEFVFYETLWPDFSDALLKDALDQYHSRERRFGSSV